MITHQNKGPLFLLSTNIFLLYTSYMTTQSLATHTLREANQGDVGFYALAILYGIFGIMSFLAPWFVEKLGPRKSLILGSFLYTPFAAFRPD